MKKQIILLMLIISAMNLSVFAQAKTKHKISEVKAYLIYEENGLMSKNILDTDFVLWNVIIGEGDAEGHSSATMVHVVISKPSADLKTDPVLQFSAVSSGVKGIKYNKTIEYQFPTEGASKTFVPFLLHDTGCQKVTMTMKLVERKKPTVVYQTLKKEIPFNCGE
jgi:hypothetical protein